MRFYVAICALSAATLAAASAGETAAGSGSLSLDEVLRAVAANNPSIKAARAKWQAMKARVPQAAAWEDLRAQGSSRAARHVTIPPNSFMDQSLMLQQEIPITGKNRSRARAATAEAGAAFEDLRRTELDVVARARAAYYRLANEHAQLDVNRRNIELLNQFAKISRDRYEVGTASQADVLTAETDTARLEEAQVDIFRRISDAQTQLNVLMNRPAQAPLGTPMRMPFRSVQLSLRQLQEVAIAARPEVQRAQNRVEAEKFRVELAQRQRVPDPMLNVQAQRYNEAKGAVSELDVGVSFALPFLNARKYSAGILEARQNAESAQQDLAAARTDALGLVRDQIKKVETAAHHYELYRDKILPLARQTVQSNRSAYEASSANFLNLITAQRVLQDAESTFVNHLADYQIALAELDAIVGIEERNTFENSPATRGSK